METWIIPEESWKPVGETITWSAWAAPEVEPPKTICRECGRYEETTPGAPPCWPCWERFMST